MKIIKLIIVLAIIGLLLGVESVLFDVPQSEPAKELTSFIILGCALLVIFGALSIVIANIISFCKNQLEKFKKAN